MITRIKTANHEEWLALRKRYIGGSDAAAVVGLNPYSSPYSLWAEKTGKIPGFEGNLATEMGSFLEDFIAQKFTEVTGKRVRKSNQSFLNDEYPFAIANIDREIVGEDAGLECKYTDSLNLKRYKGGEYPERFYCQAVHYLAVTGKKRWYLAVLIGNKEFRHFTIERDEAEIAALMAAERDFWELVKKDTPPTVDGSTATTEAVASIYNANTENTVDLSAYTASLREFLDCKAQIKELEARQDAAANTVKAFMGDSGFGLSPEFKVSWKTQTRRTFDTKRFSADFPDLDLSGYYNQSVTRPFKAEAIKI